MSFTLLKFPNVCQSLLGVGILLSVAVAVNPTTPPKSTSSAVVAPSSLGTQTVEDGDYEDSEGVASYAHETPDDATLSAEITRIFQQDLLPNFKKGIPELRIRSIDPIRMPNYTLVNIDIPYLFKCVSLVDGMIVNGLSDISRSEIVTDTAAKKLMAHFLFPKVEGTSGSGTTCYLFGFPLWRPRRGGRFDFRIHGFKVDGIFSLRPTPGEIVRLEKVDLDFKSAYTHGTKTLPAHIEFVTNWLANQFGRAFFKFLVAFGLSEVSVNVFNRFIDANAWQAILGDFF